MRIDSGPSLEEIRSSVTHGKIVTFETRDDQKVRGRVLDAKLDPGIGRVALMLEEEKTGLIWFARYRYGSIRRQCGDIGTWNLRHSEIEDLNRGGSGWYRPTDDRTPLPVNKNVA